MGAEVFQAARCNEWKGDFGMQHCVGVCRNAVVHVDVGLSCRVEGWSTWCRVRRQLAVALAVLLNWVVTVINYK